MENGGSRKRAGSVSYIIEAHLQWTKLKKLKSVEFMKIYQAPLRYDLFHVSNKRYAVFHVTLF